jgi:hypothetical protein
MAITSIKTGSSFTNLVKYNDFLAGNPPFIPSSYESIASVTANDATFTSIPGTYASLQLRILARTGTGATDKLAIRFNSITTGYVTHYLSGNGTAASSAQNTTSSAYIIIDDIPGDTALASTYAGIIIDIHDYASTTKNKTVRIFNGNDKNGSGTVQLTSGFCTNTAAITSLTITGYNGSLSGASGSVVALYGIKS